MNKYICLLVSAFLFLSFAGCAGDDDFSASTVDGGEISMPSENNVFTLYKDTVESSSYFAHALGGIDGYTYTNSAEALENSYASGFRLFEADFSLTSDGKAVLSHGFGERDYLLRLGLENLKGENAYTPTYDEFMAFSIMGKFTPMGAHDLYLFMKEHNDMFLLVDVGELSYDDTRAVYSEIVQSFENDDAALSRLIVGGHTFEMIDAVKSVYDFSLFNLYYSGKIINESFDTADFISYCENNGIQSLSCAAAYFTPVSAEELSHSSLYKFVFTINDENAAKAAFDLGADAVGTDEIK